MAAPTKDTFYCEKCNRTMNADQFYRSNNLEKYPDGKLTQCKKCVSMHVDNFDPDTYLWILQECDVPYIPDEWNRLLEVYGRDKSKLSGMTILGRYLSKMQLKQFRDFKWKDTDFLQEVANSKIEQAMKRQGYDAQQIAMAIDKASVPIPEGEIVQPTYADDDHLDDGHSDYFAEISGDNDFDDDLTDEDRRMLRLKWGKTYKPEEWIRLEQLYQEMLNSYDVQGAGHIDTLKLACKASLKANQLLDIGDIEGSQKMIKVYDTLMKSGNFTAAQNKAIQGEFVDSVSELIELCEKEGYIERYYVDQPNDKVDLTIQDMQRYTRTLIEEETSLSSMLEKAIKDNAKEDAEISKNTEAEIVDEDDLTIEDLEETLKDSDFEDFNEFLDEERELDKQEEGEK